MKKTGKVGLKKSTLEIFGDIAGCKWSLSVLKAIHSGVSRPGVLCRSIEGISTKVLNQRLAKLTRYGLISRKAFPVIPPRVDYLLTPAGRKFVGLLKKIESVQLN